MQKKGWALVTPKASLSTFQLELIRWIAITFSHDNMLLETELGSLSW